MKTVFTANTSPVTMAAMQRVQQPESAGTTQRVDEEERSEEAFEATILKLDAATIERLLQQVED